MQRQDPLDLAIITPQFMTADGLACFEREETKHLVEILMEEAPRIMILSPAPRVHEKREAAESKYHGHTLHDTSIRKRRSNQKVELVIAGELLGLSDGVNQLKSLTEALGAKCYYFAHMATEWLTFEFS